MYSLLVRASHTDNDETQEFVEENPFGARESASGEIIYLTTLAEPAVQ